MRALLMAVLATVCMNAMAGRHLCRFTQRCENYAEDGHKFCEEHECHSYGCKDAVAMITIKERDSYGGGFRSRSGSTSRRTVLCRYCRKHMCNWKPPEPDSRNGNFRGPSTVEFCDNERINDGRFCIDHTCSFNNCANCVWEFCENGGVKSMVTCRGHMHTDPEKLTGKSERSRKTPGDLKRDHEEKRQASREKEIAEKQAREEREQAEKDRKKKAKKK